MRAWATLAGRAGRAAGGGWRLGRPGPPAGSLPGFGAWAQSRGHLLRPFGGVRELSDHAPEVRNVAIVAHVDHGKTTLVDALLQSTGGINLNDRAMDSNDLEKERGITILSKSTSMKYNDTLVNIVDTPGHSDFGGEVERVLSMVDGICLVVDATDGPMPQSKFVLTKALEKNLKPIVVINKIDRPTSRLVEVENEIFDLFCSLNATDEQLEYRTIYAIGRDGWTGSSLPESTDNLTPDMTPLLDAIVSDLPSPKVEDGELRMLVSIMESDPSVHLGKLLLTGRIYSGSARQGDKIMVLNPNGEEVGESTIIKLFKRVGTQRMEIEEAHAGDIVTLAGITGGRVADTICALPEVAKGPIPSPKLDPPTISMFFSVNDSPLAGNKELSGGSKLTTQLLKERLIKETESNIAIQVLDSVPVDGRDCYEVQGRGEMQLGILIENMRREGFELSVSPPRALIKLDENGKKLEPIEEATIDVAEENAGLVMETLIARKGEMTDSFPSEDGTRRRSIFLIPTRGMVGLRSELIRKSRGDVVISTVFHGYEAHRGSFGDVRKGVLIASQDGVSTTYALGALEPRGELFIGPTQTVYTGMIVGEHTRDNDIDVNVAKMKKLTNMRASGKDEQVRLSPPRLMMLEDHIGYVNGDELIEVTPRAIRLRKAILNPSLRKNKRPSN